MNQTKQERLEYCKKWRTKNREQFNLKAREYYLKNRVKILKRNKIYRIKNIEKFRIYQKEYHRIKRDKLLPYYQEKRIEIRKKLLELVGKIECIKCGFSDWRALQFDHINGGGNKESHISRDPNKMRRDIMENPNKYQVLCANCNWIKRYENNECKNSGSYKRI